ncbi:MAG TPA: hypothetical protein VHR18_10525 [Solirubrobacterales bacterium]|jgi:hypothetical protein|nr:hypothetical protein [Solirubrobacterales bacterium]
MNRKLKTLCVALVSVFAMSAVAASTASAVEFHSAVQPQSISGTQTINHVMTMNPGTAVCKKKPAFSGTTPAKTSNTLTLVPDYDECTVFGFINVPIHENGCAFIIYISGTSEIECPSGKKIEITAPFCTVTIAPQHLATGVTYSNNAAKSDIVITTDITNELDYNECGTARTNGSYTGVTTLTGGAGDVWVE